MAKREALYVEWEDSCSNGGWHDVDTDGPARIKSIGILVRKDARTVVLSNAISEAGRHLDQLTIPRGCITKMRKVRLP